MICTWVPRDPKKELSVAAGKSAMGSIRERVDFFGCELNPGKI